jgi:hypothetical protein
LRTIKNSARTVLTGTKGSSGSAQRSSKAAIAGTAKAPTGGRVTADNPTGVPSNNAGVAHPTIGASQRTADGIALQATEGAVALRIGREGNVVLALLVEWLMLWL